jgi:DNA polymerase delta subunit 1
MEHKRSSGGDGGPPRKRQAQDDDGFMEPDIDDFLEDEDFQQPPDESVEVELGEAGRNWERPPVEPFDPKTTSIGACQGIY